MSKLKILCSILLCLGWLFDSTRPLQGEDLSVEQLEELERNPYQIRLYLDTHQGPRMLAGLVVALGEIESLEGMRQPILNCVSKLTLPELNALLKALRKDRRLHTDGYALEFEVQVRAFGAIPLLLNALKRDAKNFPISVAEALKALPWSKDHESEMNELGSQMKILLLDDDRFVVRAINDVLDQWKKLEFPLVKLLEIRLGNDHPLAKGVALELLCDEVGLNLLPTLAKLHRDESIAFYRSRCITSLLRRDDLDDRSIQTLSKLLLGLIEKGDLPLRVATVRAMNPTVDREEIVILLTGLLDVDFGEEVVQQTAEVLSRKSSIPMGPLLESRFAKRTKGYREAVTLALGYFDTGWSGNLLIEALEDRKLQAMAAESLGRLKSDDEFVRATRIEALMPLLKSRSSDTRLAALWALGRMEAPILSKDIASLLPSLLPRRKSDPLIEALLKKIFGFGPEMDQGHLRRALEADPQPAPRPLPPPTEESRLNFYDLETLSRCVTFVIDTSESMNEKSRWLDVRRALIQQVATLEADTLFNLVAFSSRSERWKDFPVRSSWRNKSAFQEHVMRLRPRGSTNISDALSDAFRMWQLDSIYFLTDGLPTQGITNLDELTRWVARNRPWRGKIFSVGLDIPEAQNFLRQISLDSGGDFKMIGD